MNFITVTDEAMAAIEAAAIFPFKNTSVKGPNGWRVKLDTETYEGLLYLMMPGESESDTIIRLCRKAVGKKDN
jgi:hypothetical protein